MDLPALVDPHADQEDDEIAVDAGRGPAIQDCRHGRPPAAKVTGRSMSPARPLNKAERLSPELSATAPAVGSPHRPHPRPFSRTGEGGRPSIRPELLVRRLLETERRRFPKVALRQARLPRRANDGQFIGFRKGFVGFRREAWVVVEVAAQANALLADARTQARAAEAGLETPVQEMPQKDREPVDEFALLRSSHALDLLGDVGDVHRSEATGPEQPRQLDRPRVDI